MYIYIYRFIVNSTARNIERTERGMNAGFELLYSEEKIQTRCWLYDYYGHLARKFWLRNFRLIRPYQDDEHMFTVDRRL